MARECVGVGIPLEIRGLGAFGAPGRPRVLWAGVVQPPEGLFALQRACARVVRDAGVGVEDRAFSAHVTLGRARPGGRVGAEALTSHLQCHINTLFGIIEVRTLRMVRSRLVTQGPIYQTLRAWPLGSPGPSGPA